MEILIVSSLWIIYCAQQGWNDGRFFANGTAHYIKTNSTYNIHTSLLFGRFLVWTLALVLVFLTTNIIADVVKVGVGLMALFPFIHEGVYYSTRKRIDSPNEYPDSHLALWVWYRSSSSTAKINFYGWFRLLSFIVGLGIFIFFDKLTL